MWHICVPPLREGGISFLWICLIYDYMYVCKYWWKDHKGYHHTIQHVWGFTLYELGAGTGWPQTWRSSTASALSTATLTQRLPSKSSNDSNQKKFMHRLSPRSAHTSFFNTCPTLPSGVTERFFRSEWLAFGLVFPLPPPQVSMSGSWGWGNFLGYFWLKSWKVMHQGGF